MTNAITREEFLDQLKISLPQNQEEWREVRDRAEALAIEYQTSPCSERWQSLWDTSQPFVAYVCWWYWENKCQHGRFVDAPFDLVGEVDLAARKFADSWRREISGWSTWLNQKTTFALIEAHRKACRSRMTKRTRRKMTRLSDYREEEAAGIGQLMIDDRAPLDFESVDTADEVARLQISLAALGSRRQDIMTRFGAGEPLRSIGLSWGISESRTSQLVAQSRRDLESDPYILSQIVSAPYRPQKRPRRLVASV